MQYCKFFSRWRWRTQKTFKKKKITWPPCRNIYHHYKNHATRFLLLKKPANRESLGIDTDLETALPAFFSASAARLSAKITAGVVFSLFDVVIISVGGRLRMCNKSVDEALI